MTKDELKQALVIGVIIAVLTGYLLGKYVL